MLELNNIVKDYKAGDLVVHALKGVSVGFRDSEFVSILGPSGCGKTTLLNIIGGLDHYTSGDLVIDGISTTKFSDRDWDTYRNDRVGFVFQSYNLIPHQTILENVELALTIAGVSKDERVKRAKEALDKVGLKDLYNKKPNQLSGGQCQRVSIARALVNNPEILLADEPTGALDTQTSIQIMELIKEIAKDCLVIMVTHNPSLAKKYSTRIIELLDGELISDSNPYLQEADNKKPKKGLIVENAKPNKTAQKKKKKSKLSFWQAFKLSAKNLKSKFKRTLMVCIAGSIGIIGVASVLAISTGVRNYVKLMQNDMLSGNPITISEEAINLSTLFAEASTDTQKQALTQSTEQNGKINVNSLIAYLAERSGSLANLKVSNDISEDYINYVSSLPEEYYAAIAYDYGLDVTNNLYTSINLEQYGTQNLSLSAITQIYTNILNGTDFGGYASLITSLSDNFMQLIDSESFVLSQYNIVSNSASSKFATEANEIMIVLDENGMLSDLMLAQLGYYTQEEFINIIYKVTDNSKYDSTLDKTTFDYDELLGKTFTYYPNNTIYTKTNYDDPVLSAANPFTYSAYQNNEWENGIELKITAILSPKEDISYGCLDSGFYYTAAFAKQMIADATESEIVKYLTDNENLGGAFTSMNNGTTDMGVTYKFSYHFEDKTCENITGFVGSMSQTSFILGAQGSSAYTLSLRDIGGISLPNKISIYPTDFNYKDAITQYLDKWNSDATLTFVSSNGEQITLTAAERSEIVYTDNLSLIITLINNMISIVTTALVAFTALSLVVSTVMISIITYVSVIERIKEIGVIRSLGGRKRDVSNLFIAETFIIGGIAGLIGILITYILSGILNLIVGSLIGISTIASLPIWVAVVMIAISIGLTTISGLIPASVAAKKDPVVALRSE